MFVRSSWIRVLGLLLVSGGIASSSAASSHAAGVLMPPPALSLGVYQSGIPSSLDRVGQLEGAAGGRFAILHWYVAWGGYQAGFDETSLERVREHGSVPLISWEPWAGTYDDANWSLRRAVLSGRSDDYIRTWARGLAGYGGPVLLRFAHEMNDSGYPWAIGTNGNTNADYVAAWRYVRAIFQSENATNVLWVWNPNLLSASMSAGTYQSIFSAAFPGDDQVDLVGLDVYNTGTNSWARSGWLRTPAWESFSDILAAPYQAVTAMSARPVMLPEVASAEAGGSKAAWLADAMSPATLSQFPRLQAMVWFDMSKEDYWALGSTPAALQGWVNAARPYMLPVPPQAQAPSPPSVPSESVSVAINDQSGFVPNAVTVPVGGAVTWLNTGQKVHSAVSNKGVNPSFDSGGMANGQSFTFRFSAPGAYGYHSSTEPLYSLNELRQTIVSYQFNATVYVR